MSDEKNKTYSPTKTLKRLFSISKAYLPWYILLCIAASLRSVTALVDTEVFRRMINGATEGNLSYVKTALIIGLIALVFGQILDFVIDYFGEILNYSSTRALQSKILSKLTKIKMSKYEGYHSGDLIDRLDNCASDAQTGMNINTRTIFEKTLVIILSMTYLIVLNFRLMICTLLFILLLPIIINPLAKFMRDLYDKRQRRRVEKDSFVQDSFQGSEIVRSFSLASRLGISYLAKYNSFFSLIKKLLFFESTMNSIHWIIIFGGDLFILGYGGYLASKDIMGVGSVIAFLLMFEKTMQPISEISMIWPKFQQALSSANRVFEILDLPEEMVSEEVTEAYGREVNVEDYPNRSLGISNVTFGYNEEAQVLKGLNFCCEEGNVTALVGPSGGGKSTILKMLIRLYEPSSGEITCGDVPITSINPQEWRKSLAYVSQEPLLFSGTILENIKYGNEAVTYEQVVEAAKFANIHDTILSTSEGYDSKIGEQGIRFSGGERQRISIARAMLRNPKLLILDEPTSALDNENEKLIQEALDKLMEGRTTVIVAHRLSTIQNADKIVFIEEGKVLEQGNHFELMELQGKYYSMHEKIKQTAELGIEELKEKEVAV
jgi:ATP-binding cassette subfamily B protein AbcA/BmrA